MWFIRHANSHMTLIYCHSYTFYLKSHVLYSKIKKFWNHGVVNCLGFFHLYSHDATVASSHGFLEVESASEFQRVTHLHCVGFRLMSQWIYSRVMLPEPCPLRENKLSLLWCTLDYVLTRHHNRQANPQLSMKYTAKEADHRIRNKF